MARQLEQNELVKFYEDVKRATEAIGKLELPCQPKEFLTIKSLLIPLYNNRKELLGIEENSTDKDIKSAVGDIFHHLSTELPKQVTLFLKKAIQFLPDIFEAEHPDLECAICNWLNILWYATDKHEEAKKSCCSCGFVSFIFQEMLPRLTDIQWGEGTLKEKIKVSSMGIVCNCSKISANHEYYGKVNAVDKLMKLRNDTNKPKAQKINSLVLLTLGYLIDESNSDSVGVLWQLKQAAEKEVAEIQQERDPTELETLYEGVKEEISPVLLLLITFPQELDPIELETLYEGVKEAIKAIDELKFPCQPKEFEAFLKKLPPLFKLSSICRELYDIEEKSTEQDAKSTVADIWNHVSIHLPEQIKLFLKKVMKYYPDIFKAETGNKIEYKASQSEESLSAAFGIYSCNLLSTLINITDRHEETQKSCCRDGLIALIFQEIFPLLDNIDWDKGSVREGLMCVSMDIVYNCCKLSANHKYYLEVNAVDVLVQLRKDTNHLEGNDTNATALLTLGYLIDESNSDKIICGHETIDILISCLKECLEEPDRRAYGFRAEELAEGLQNISGPDDNKQLICKRGGHEVLTELLNDAKDDKETIASCNALWSLCFSEQGRLLTKENHVLLEKLKELSESEKSEVKEAADGVLWQVEQGEEKEKTADADSDIKGAVNGAGHIMLSYQWDDQKMVKDIAAALKERGYNVWIDVEKMQGNIYDAMADGVEQASVVVVCVSRKYKNSNNCRAEVQRSHELKKTILPLMMEKDYRPDGWLALIISGIKYIEFSSLENNNMEKLYKELHTICPALPEAQITQNIEEPVQAVNEPYLGHHPLTSYDIPDSGAARTPVAEIKNHSINHERIYEISQWSNIEGYEKKKLERLTGVHLVMLHKFEKKCPKRYYHRCEVRQELGFNDLLDFLEFTNHIDKLF
eukprot:gene16714-18408_t